MEFADVRDKPDAEAALRSMNGVHDVRDGSTGTVQAIDFRMFQLQRPTDTSNFVFRRLGTQFQGALLRLPRVSKDTYSEAEVRNAILSAIPPGLHGCLEIRLEPEVELDDSYHHLHVQVNGTVQDALHVTQNVATAYQPL